MTTTDAETALRIMIVTVPMVFEMPFFISLLYQFYCVKEHIVHHHFKCTAISTFIFSIIHSISETVCVIHQKWNIITLKQSYIISLTGIGAMFMTASSIYAILLLRLYHVFHESIYQIPTRQLLIHTINIAISMICVVTSSSFFYYSDMRLYVFIFGIVWIILLTLGYIHLLYAFHHNLFLLVLSQRKSIPNQEKTQSMIELNVRQIKVLLTIRKHSILGCFIIFGNFCAVVHGVAAFRVKDNPFIFISRVFWSVFVFIGPLGIYLGFPQNKALYRRCCYLCDIKCENICILLAENKLNKQMNEIDK